MDERWGPDDVQGGDSSFHAVNHLNLDEKLQNFRIFNLKRFRYFFIKNIPDL